MRAHVCSIVCLASLVAHNTIGHASSELTLRGSKVDYVRWTPRDPSFSIGQLEPDETRLQTLLSQALHTTTPLYSKSFDIRDDDTVITTTTVTRYFVSKNGLDSGALKFSVDEHSEVVDIREAYTLLPDGARAEVDPQTIELATDDTDSLFTDTVIATVNYPKVVQGAAIVLVVETRVDTKAHPLPWSHILYTNSFTRPVESYRVKARWTDEKNQPNWKTDDPDLKCEQTSSTLECNGQHLTLLPNDKQILWRDIVPSFAIGRDITWEEVVALDEEIVESVLAEAPASITPEELGIADTDRPRERLRKIHRYVLDNIRYVGFEHGTGGIIPRTPSKTYANRYGDCKDMTTLFIDLARQNGIRAYPVLTTFRRRDPAKLIIPASSYFDHMIACADVDSEKVCVDLTDKYGDSEFVSSANQGKVSLDVQGKSSPQRLPSMEERWIESISTKNLVAASGSMREVSTRTLIGPFASWYRRKLAAKNLQQREDWLRKRYKRIVSEEVSPELELSGLDNDDGPIRVQTTATYPSMVDLTEDEPMLIDNESYLREIGHDYTSENAYWPETFTGVRYQSNVVYTLEEGLEFRGVGPEIDFRTEFGELTRKYTLNAGAVTVVTRLRMPQRTVTMETQKRFNKFLKLVRQYGKIWFTLQTTKI